MARTHDARSTLRALATYGDVILEANLNRGNRIALNDDNVGALETLEHHRLVWRLGDTEDLQLKNVLVRLLDHITESERRRFASAQVDRLWSDLNRLFVDYREAKKRAAFTDKSRIESEIKECLSEIIEDIRNATDTFSSYISSGFSYITDMDLRIRKNHDVIERAGQLNSLFESFNTQDMADQAGNDPFLKRLLLKYLPAALEQGQKNLSYALNQLRLTLVRLREDQRLSKLVGGFENYFANNRGYIPSIDDLDLGHCPTPLNNVVPFAIVARGDIYDPADDEDLIVLAQTARTVGTDQQGTEPAAALQTVEFDVAGAFDPEEEDPVDELIEQLVQFVVDGDIGDGEIDALEALSASGLALDAAAWLSTLEAQIDSLTPNDQIQITVEYKSQLDPLYKDNLYITGMTLRRSNESRI
jgi:hypothetical protein